MHAAVSYTLIGKKQNDVYLKLWIGVVRSFFFHKPCDASRHSFTSDLELSLYICIGRRKHIMHRVIVHGLPNASRSVLPT
jgi:hypothetical protein